MSASAVPAGAAPKAPGQHETTAEKPAPQRPLPTFADPDTAAFWRATGEHKLTYQQTADGRVVFFPRRHAGGEVRESAGEGVVYTFTVVRQHGHPFFRAHAPYVVALVDLDEGFRLMAEVDADPETIHIGQRVRVGWEDHEVDGERLAIPVFTPAG
jgi:uncharacterized OB-fold protein